MNMWCYINTGGRGCFSAGLFFIFLTIASTAACEELLRNEKRVILDQNWRGAALYSWQIFLQNQMDMAKYKTISVPASVSYRTVDRVRAEITQPDGEIIRAVRRGDELIFPVVAPRGRLDFSYRLTVAEPEMPGVFFDSFGNGKSPISRQDYYQITFPRPVAFCWLESGRKYHGFGEHFILPESAYGNTRIQVSTVCQWQQVKEEYRKLYAGKIDSASEKILAGLAAGWTQLTREEQLDEALRYIRRHVRYRFAGKTTRRLAPRSPRDVLASGSGDCKDMTVLAVALLRLLGFKADPVLIAPVEKYNPDFPDPFIFTHAVVRVAVNGNIRCYDLTLSQEEECKLSHKQRFFFPLDKKRSMLFTVQMAGRGN